LSRRKSFRNPAGFERKGPEVFKQKGEGPSTYWTWRSQKSVPASRGRSSGTGGRAPKKTSNRRADRLLLRKKKSQKDVHHVGVMRTERGEKKGIESMSRSKKKKNAEGSRYFCQGATGKKKKKRDLILTIRTRKGEDVAEWP